MKKISCSKCKHYFITWEKRFPRGCRAMNFKSKIMPSTFVYESSGMPCQRFEPKEKGEKKKG